MKLLHKIILCVISDRVNPAHFVDDKFCGFLFFLSRSLIDDRHLVGNTVPSYETVFDCIIRHNSPLGSGF